MIPRWVVPVSTAIVILAGSAFGQLGTGAISGTVQDPSGAIVPLAQIIITQVDTGLTRVVQSGANGQFLAPVLPSGVYRLHATKASEDQIRVLSTNGTRTS